MDCDGMRNPFRFLLPLLLCLRASAASGHELGTIHTTATFRRDATYRVDVAIDREHLPPGFATSAGLPLIPIRGLAWSAADPTARILAKS